MLKVSCLVFNTELAESLKDLVQYIGYTKISNGKDAGIGSIYNDIRKAGIEVDLETIGHIYNNSLPKDVKQVMSDEDVYTFVRKNYTDAIQRAAKLEDKEGEKQIGQDAPEQHIVNGILNMFTNANVSDNTTKSNMLTMQDALWKGIQRKLDLKEKEKPQTKEQWKDVLNRALGYEQLGIRDLNGRLNSIKDLYTEMNNELSKAKQDLRNEGNFAAAEQFDEMTKQLEASTYSLLFSKGEAKNLLYDMMKEAGFGKTLSNGKTIIDWNKLAGEIGSVQDIRANVQRVLEDNGFNADVIEGVKNSLQNEFTDLQAESIRQQLDNKQKMASEISNDIIDNAIKKVIGMPLNEWIEKGNLETLTKIREAAKKELIDSKYTPELKVAIVNRIADFFENKYAKLETIEAKNAVNVLTNGKGALDWIKKNGIQNKSELALKLNDWLSSRNLSDSQKQNIRSEFQRILDAENRSETELKNRVKATDREVASKTDLKRLAELNNLGIFESAHDRLLNNLIGVSDLQQADIADLKELADAASELYKHIDKNYGNDIYGSSAFQSIQRSIDSIITRNINNKTRLNKIISAIKNFFDVYLTGLLIAPFTILENFYSGIKEVVAPLISGKRSLSKEDFSVWANMLKDVTARGQSFGEEVGSFAPRELYSNTLKFKWKNASLKEKVESALNVVMLPARIGLLGLDSANKVLITNKTFHNAIYQVLTKRGMNAEEAEKTLNESLHGQSFQQAKEQAKSILEKTNQTLSDKFKIPVNNATITRLANDLVKANLNSNRLLDNDIIEAALKSSYHVAGLGLGHEPNNPLSAAVKGVREKMQKKEQRLTKEKKWDELAIERMKNTAVNVFGIKFLGGASNWIYLRVQSGFGLGVLTGLLGDWKGTGKVDFDNKEHVEQYIKDVQNARNKIGRGLTGISVTAMSYLLGFILYGGGGDDDEKEKRLAQLEELQKKGWLTNYQKDNLTTDQKNRIKAKLIEEKKQLELDTNIYQRIKANYMGSKLFKKVAPDVMLMQYYLNTDKNELVAVLDYAQNQAGLGSQYSTSSKLQNAAGLAYKGDTEAAQGELASIGGDSFGVPLWRGYKEWGRLGKWISGKDVSSNYKQPTEFTEGLWGGGMLEDLGFYNRDSKITNLPGIGGKSYEKFKEKGIERMTDLQKHPDWYNMKYKNESGDMVYILDATARKKAKAEADKWFEENN